MATRAQGSTAKTSTASSSTSARWADAPAASHELAPDNRTAIPVGAFCSGSETPENEPDCGLPLDTVNGGCNSNPPILSWVSCGESVCGTAGTMMGTRDTDWYAFSVPPEGGVYRWTVTASFDVHVGFLEVSTCPAPSLLPDVVAAAGETITVTRNFPGGTWWAFVAPQFFVEVPCGAQYVATLTCGSNCCEAHGTTGCDNGACQATVCAADPFCCDTEWDGICAGEAQDLCGGLCACDADTTGPAGAPEGNVDSLDFLQLIAQWGSPGNCQSQGSCCVANGTPGCDDAGCESLVCAADPFCCDTEWDQLCADEAAAMCGNTCTDCCDAHKTTGCDDLACEAIVCAFDSFCCDTAWDGICAGEAFDLCGELCPPSPCASDITGPNGRPDGVVDALDFLLLIAQWGSPGNCS